MVSRLSVNIHGHAVPDRPHLFDFLMRMQPAAVLVLDNLDLARQIKQRIPACTVIFREYEHNRLLHEVYPPEQWLNAHAHQAEGSIALNVMNEQRFDTPTLKWLCDLMLLAVPRDISLVLGNFAVGNPEPSDWTLAREFLSLLNTYRNLFILGLHEYAGGVITSGLYGGYPDNAGVEPGEAGGLNLVPSSNWPKDVASVTRWHCGRFKFLLDFCKDTSIKPPRIILTEHGFDDTSDIKPWLDKLPKTEPYQNIRGWRSLRNAWETWYGREWRPERVYFEQLKWANEMIYANSPVEAQCIFCWGHSSDDWIQFDIAEAGELQRLLIEYAGAQLDAPLPAPAPPAPLPIPAPAIGITADDALDLKRLHTEIATIYDRILTRIKGEK